MIMILKFEQLYIYLFIKMKKANIIAEKEYKDNMNKKLDEIQ